MRRFGSLRSLSSVGTQPPKLLAVGPYAGYKAPLVNSLSNGFFGNGAVFGNSSTVLAPMKYKKLTLADFRISGDSDSMVFAVWAQTIDLSGTGTINLDGYPGGDAQDPCGTSGGNGGDKSAGGGAAYVNSGSCCSCVSVTGGDAGGEINHGDVDPGNAGGSSGCGASGGSGGQGASIPSTVQSNSWAFQNGFAGGNTMFANGSPGIKLIGGAGAGGSTFGLNFGGVAGGGGGGRGFGSVWVCTYLTGDGTVGLSSEGGSGGAGLGCGAENGGDGGSGAIDICAKNYVANAIGFVNGANFRLFEIRRDNTINPVTRSSGESWSNGP